jgi:hypothetical protein
MPAQFDEKGKIFTPIVKKIPCDAIIQTANYRIEGKVHIRPDDRLKDDMNGTEMFVAVTEAVVYDTSGQVTFRTNFMLVNRTQIIWLMPANEVEPL